MAPDEALATHGATSPHRHLTNTHIKKERKGFGLCALHSLSVRSRVDRLCRVQARSQQTSRTGYSGPQPNLIGSLPRGPQHRVVCHLVCFASAGSVSYN